MAGATASTRHRIVSKQKDAMRMEEHLVGLLEAIPILILSSAFAARNCYQSGTHSHFGNYPGLPRMEKRSTRNSLSSRCQAHNCLLLSSQTSWKSVPSRSMPLISSAFLARLRLTSPRCIATLRTATQGSTQDVWGIAQQSLATAIQDEFLCQNWIPPLRRTEGQVLASWRDRKST